MTLDDEVLFAELIMDVELDWSYETDEFKGTCIIAKDEMQIKFVFYTTGKNFVDVLKIDEIIDELLREPVSVESMAQSLHAFLPYMKIKVMGRAVSHGWITAIVEPDKKFKPAWLEQSLKEKPVS